MTISELKKDAKSRLKGKIGKALAITVLCSLISMLLSLIGVFITNTALNLIYRLIILIITFPFSFGLVASMMKLSRNQTVKLTDFISDAMQNIGKIWGVFGWTLLKLLIPTLIYIISFVVLIFAITLNASSGIILLTSILVIIIAIYYVIKNFSYILSSYLLFDEPNLSSREIVEKSAELMKGNKGKYFILGLSFIGWILLIFILYVVLVTVLSSLLGALGAIISIIIYFAALFVLILYIDFTIICFYEDLNSYTENTVSANEVNVIE